MRHKIHIVPIIILVIILGALLFASTYTLKDIEIVGCNLASEDQVREAIKDETIMSNTLLLYLKNKFGKIEDIPFVSKMDIEFVSKHKVRVEVYEKSVAGCLEYMESYVFFDKDGIVMETAKDRKEGVPYIKGLTIKSWQLGEKLPIENKKKFDMILNITQLLEKYELENKYDADTVGGWAGEMLEKVPEVGDTFTLEKHQFTVTEMDGFRVTKIQVTPLPEAEEAPAEPEEKETEK